MIDKVREWAEAKLKAWNHLAPDGMKNLQLDELDEFKTIRIILALVEVVESVPEKAKWVDVHGNVCFDSDVMSKLGDALTACDQRIAEVLGEKESCPPCIEGKNHRFDDGGECVDCGVVEHEEADPHGKGGFVQKPCQTCGGSGNKYTTHRCTCFDEAIGCDCCHKGWKQSKEPCPDCPPKSTYYHSDPSTNGVEKRTQEEDWLTKGEGMKVKGRITVDIKMSIKDLIPSNAVRNKRDRDLLIFEYEDKDGIHERELARGDSITLSIPIEFESGNDDTQNGNV